MAETVMVNVLGALRIAVGDDEVDLGGRRQQMALAALLLHRRPLTASALAELVWDDTPPPTAAGTLYAYIARLRRVLGPAGIAIVGDRGGYHLDVDDHLVDLRVFEAALSAASDMRLPEDASRIAATLGPAVEAWPASLLEGSSGEPRWVDVARTRIQSDMTRALGLLATSELALGMCGRAVARLVTLVDEDPLQENLVADLMLGLHRLGRQSDALAAYSSCRQALREELGVVPGSRLQEMHQRVLRNDAGLAWTPAPLLTGRSHLPPRDLGFHGREAELAEISTLMRTGGRVVCSGLGGVGKTALVAELAHRHSGPVLWLAGDSDASLATELRDLALRLGLGGGDMDDWLRRTWDHLASVPDLLVVVDNVPGPELLRRYSPVDPGRVRTVVTSRHAAWASGTSSVLDLECFDPSEASAYLAKRSPRSQEQDTRRLADELGCLPLALAQASAFMDQAAISCAEYLRIFRERRGEILGQGAPHDHPETVRTTWTLSLEQANTDAPQAAALLDVLAFLDGGRVPITLLYPLFSHAEPALDVAEAVAQLRRYSLVRRQDDVISMHRLLQAVVRESLTPARAEASWTSAVELVRRVLAGADDPVEARRALTGSVLGLALHAEALGSLSPDLVSMMRACSADLVNQGSVRAAASLMEIAVRAAQKLQLPPAVLGVVHGEYAEALDCAGDLAAALVHSQAALSLLQQGGDGDELTLAVARTRRAHVLNCAGRPDEATRLHRKALPALERSGGAPYVGALVDLGYAEWASHRLGQAESSFERALRVEASVDTQRLRCAATAGLGLVHQDRGDHDAALAHLESAHRMLAALYDERDHPDVGLHLDKLAFLLSLRGEIPAAMAAHEEAVAILSRCFGPEDPRVAVACSNRGLTRAVAGDHDGAESDHHRAFVSLRTAYGDSHPLTLLAGERGGALRALG